MISRIGVVLMTIACLAGVSRGADDASAPKITKLQNLEYVPGGGAAQSLDLYLPASDKPLPLIVYIHGGGWEGGSKDGCWAFPETARGYAAASLNYRLSKQAKFPAQIQDCQAAIRWLRANAKQYNINPDRIGVWGDSAGGHLSALLGTAGGIHAFEPIGGNLDQSDKVQAVCDFYGPSDFLSWAGQETPKNTLHCSDPNCAMSHLFGGLISEHKDQALAASPVHYISKDNPPFLIEHGTEDPLVPPAQSEELANDLKKAGVNATLLIIEGAGHGNKMVNVPGWLTPIEAFFDQHLKGQPAKPLVAPKAP